MTVLIAKNVSVNIAEKWICQQLNFQIQTGEVWGILGPNGSGKTTLLHTLAGILPLSAGEILLKNRPFAKWSLKELAQFRALLFQMTDDFSAQSLWEYCSLSRYPHLATFPTLTKNDEKIIANALSQVELYDQKKKKMFMLSGGERRRLGIAAVLAQTPSLYFLDEPTNHLDIRHQTMVLSLFKSLAQNNGAAIIMALHDINQAQQFCDRILLLFSNGNTLQGSVEEMLTPQHLSQLYGQEMQAIHHENNCFWVPQY